VTLCPYDTYTRRMREEARADRRWEDADALRAQIREAGYEIEDTRYGPRLRRAT